MRTSLALFGSYMLVLLLAGSLPVGVSDAVHGGALVHAALPHVHATTVSTRPAPHAPAARPLPTSAEQLANDASPAVDAGTTTSSQIPSSGLTPSLPRSSLNLPLDLGRRLLVRPQVWPDAPGEPPPTPPPTSLLSV